MLCLENVFMVVSGLETRESEKEMIFFLAGTAGYPLSSLLLFLDFKMMTDETSTVLIVYIPS